MRNIVILNSLHFSYPLPILMRVSYNTLIVKQNTSDYYKYSYKDRFIIQGKWGITCYNDRDKISSGTEEIQGNRKADLQLQLKVKW